MTVLNFKSFLEADENDPNKDKGPPFQALTTVVGIDQKDIPDAVNTGSYLLGKVIGKNQYSAAVAKMNPKLKGKRVVGASFEVDPNILQNKNTAAYYKNSQNPNALKKKTGWIDTDTAADLMTLGFPSTGAGGAGAMPGIGGAPA
jgi:hypothetical protein